MELFLDKLTGIFLASKDSTSPLGALRAGENITEPLKLWLLDRPATAGLPLVPAALDAPFTDLILAARPAADLEGEDLLFSCAEFTAVGAGSTLHYEGLITLNVAALQAELTGQKTLAALIDVEVVNADNTRNSRLVMHAPCTILRDIYRGTEGVPAEGDPPYPLPGVLLTTGPDSATIKRGTAPVGAGEESIAIGYDTPFAGLPATVQAWLMPASGGALIQCAVDHSTITTAGFTAVFGAATPDADYRLGWLAIA